MITIWIKVIDKIGDQVLDEIDFNVGYYEGKQQAEIWLASVKERGNDNSTILNVILHFGMTVEKQAE